ncbi:MAG: PQQ-binding-like beta-propeller repeat protein [Anaerolineales bacterium]|jgi:outer membrane protein assembly factor BamB
MMKTKTLVITIMLIFLSLLISGCRGSGFIAGSWPGITVDGDTAYIAYNQAIYSIDLTDEGDQIDTFPAEPVRGGTFYHAPLLLEDGTMIEGSYNNKIYSIDLESGAVKEFFNTTKNRWIASLVFEDGLIYAPNSNGTLYAINLDGESPWNVETGAAIWAKPLLDNGRLYIASQDHYLYAINASTGNEIWKTDLGASAVNSPVMDENGTLYIGSFGRKVFAINSDSGSVEWEFDTQGWVWGSPILGVDNTLYATDLDANLYALDTTDGSLIWDKQVQAGTSITGSPLLYNEALFVVTRSGSIAAYDLQGERLWKEEIGTEENGIEFHGTPVLAGENLILVSAVGSEQIIFAFNDKLESLWQFTPAN